MTPPTQALIMRHWNALPAEERALLLEAGERLLPIRNFGEVCLVELLYKLGRFLNEPGNDPARRKE